MSLLSAALEHTAESSPFTTLETHACRLRKIVSEVSGL
jgi:hypothetical protein